MRRLSTKWLRYERGDTLIEVTIALAILSAVLTSAFVTANQAFKTGQAARERSMLVGSVQQQADALKSFRDSHTWAQFVGGKSGNSYPACDNAGPSDYCGVNSRYVADCDGVKAGFQTCFHMELRPIERNGVTAPEWVPSWGGQSIALGGHIGISSSAPDPGYTLGGSIHYYDFTVSGIRTALGKVYDTANPQEGTSNSASVQLRLIDLDSLR